MIRPRWQAIAPGAVLIVLALFQPWLEQRMVTHMVVELPAIFAIGWWAATPPQRRGPAWLRRVNTGGLSGLAAAMVVSTVWMLPLALDAAVLSPGVGWLKVASVLLAGWLTRISLREARPVIRAFFVLNWVWMTATAGVLYQEAPQRLCSTYLLGDQTWTGIGLVVLAIAVVTFWMLLAFRERPGPAASSHSGHRHAQAASPTSPPGFQQSDQGTVVQHL